MICGVGLCRWLCINLLSLCIPVLWSRVKNIKTIIFEQPMFEHSTRSDKAGNWLVQIVEKRARHCQCFTDIVAFFCK